MSEPQVAKNELGTHDHPLERADQISLAEAFFFTQFMTEEGVSLLYEYRRSFWYWEGGHWNIRSQRWLEDRCIKWLRVGVWSIEGTKDEEGPRRVVPSRGMMEGVVRCLQALIMIPDDEGECPLWVGTGKPPVRMSRTIAFQDVLIDASSKGGAPVERTMHWFDRPHLPVNYDPKAKCPRWMTALTEWSDGNPQWERLLKRIFGYALMPHREYEKWVLLYGKVRSGKGTILHILRQLIGDQGYVGTTLNLIASRFGGANLRHAKVIVVGEVNEMDSKAGGDVATMIKMIVGRDPMSIDVKHQPVLSNVTIPALPIMQSNEIPNFPNKGRGLSSKMLLLPFDRSFADAPQYDLRQVLEKELAGIACWAVEGARELEKERRPEKKFVMSDAGAQAVERYLLHVHPLDAFLTARFVKSPGMFVTTEAIWRQWLDWKEENQVNYHISRHKIRTQVVAESSWELRMTARQHNSKKGVEGMIVRRERDDDV